MLSWHARLSWVKGGFARMTIFFVLAGFLATTSLVHLQDRGEPRPFRTFWARRATRLLPITVFGLLGATLVTWVWGGPVARETISGDVTASALSVVNWRFIVDQRPYGALFESPSALQHFWSLSVEEQCFLLLPVALGIMTVLVGRDRRRQAVAAVILGTALAITPALTSTAPDTAYFGTHVRGGEFLAGAALALLWSVQGQGVSRRATRVWGATGTAGLLAITVVMLTVDRTASWVYTGGMGLFSLPTVAIIGGVLVGGRTLTSVLSLPPLVWLGRAAFSVYVTHWLIFVALDGAWPTLDPTTGALLKIPLGIAGGGLVHILIERPLLPTGTGLGRSPSPSLTSRPIALPVLACLVLVATGISFLVPPLEPVIDFEAAQAAQTRLSRADARAAIDNGPGAGPAAEVGTPGSVKVSVFGGSTALLMGLAVVELISADPRVVDPPGYAVLGCGVIDSGLRRDPDPSAGDEGLWVAPPEECSESVVRWQAAARMGGADVALVVASKWDLIDWDLPGPGPVTRVGEPVFDDLLRVSIAAHVAALRSGGVRHVLLTTPPSPPPGAAGSAAPDRLAAYGEVVAAASAADPELTVIDVGNWTRTLSAAEFAEGFPDGTHPTEAMARRIWAELITPALQPMIDRLAAQPAAASMRSDTTREDPPGSMVTP